MTSWSTTFTAAVTAALAERADPTRAAPMAAYMRDQFPFLGVDAAGQKAAQRSALAVAGRPTAQVDVVAAVDELWAVPEREHRYVGCGLVRGWAPRADASFVSSIGGWITDQPWWDTCDALAHRGVGVVVRAHPDLRTTMDEWLHGDDMWLTRAALLHMGRWRGDIDRYWVFAACLAVADREEFFIRKAIGWILRDLASTDVDAVRDFVNGRGSVLSPLSIREALKRR